jgi:hypothetical protein
MALTMRRYDRTVTRNRCVASSASRRICIASWSGAFRELLKPHSLGNTTLWQRDLSVLPDDVASRPILCLQLQLRRRSVP